MAKIVPFKGLRPIQEWASSVATLPYDVCSVEEARQYKDAPYHFYHVTRAEIDLPPGTDVHGQEVYDKAAENLKDLMQKGILQEDASPCYYIYRLVMNGRAQTGLIAGSSLDDYRSGIIKKHEFTRPEKEQDRIDHIKTTRAQTGVVFLAYNNVAAIDALIEGWKNEHAPTYDFISEDGIGHTFWTIDDPAVIENITQLFRDQVPATYIADGHHRAASAEKVAAASTYENGPNDPNYFLTAIFPANELEIQDYNRVVKDLNGLSEQGFLERLSHDFEVAPVGTEAYRPQAPHDFGLYLSGKWYRLKAKEGSYAEDPIGVLDVSILQKNVLDKILGIQDPRIDTRVEFVGGIRGLGELEKRVDSGNMAAAFSCYPVSIEQLFEVADSGEVMPPKSTWFEPKTRDGLVVYRF